MSAQLMNRIEKLESAITPDQPEALRIIRMIVTPENEAEAAICEGLKIDRMPGEPGEDFRGRAIHEFNFRFGSPCVEFGEYDELI